MLSRSYWDAAGDELQHLLKVDIPRVEAAANVLQKKYVKVSV
jgi:hypothetical protein